MRMNKGGVFYFFKGEMMKKLICLFAIMATSGVVHAVGDFSFSAIDLKGNGCPAGSFQVVTTPDQKTVSILFDKFSVEVPGYNGEKVDHKICHINITANIPVGQKIDALDASIDFRGSANMDIGTQAQFQSMLVQWQGMRKFDSNIKYIENKSWKGGTYVDWISSKKASFPIGSNCALPNDRQVNVTLRNLLTATINNGVDPHSTSALITIDSNDIKGALHFSLRTSQCEGIGPRPNPFPNQNPGAGSCTGRIITCRLPSVWSPSLCRCVVAK